ncbi:hypothetical protein GCM10023075_13510 [Streptosporangium album]
MCALIFEYGIATVSWYAEFAFRRRVSMSAIGSVIVMAGGLPHRGFHKGPAVRSWALEAAPGEYDFYVRLGMTAQPAMITGRAGGYQLDLVMPGSSPRCAISRKQMRHRPNFL